VRTWVDGRRSPAQSPTGEPGVSDLVLLHKSQLDNTQVFSDSKQEEVLII